MSQDIIIIDEKERHSMEFYELANSYGHWKRFSNDKELRYRCIRARAKSDACWDYGRGLVELTIYLSINYLDKGIKKYNTRLIITNIDDGMFAADSKIFDTFDEAREHTEKVFKAYSEWESQQWAWNLPNEKELNEFLVKYGMWGQRE